MKEVRIKKIRGAEQHKNNTCMLGSTYSVALSVLAIVHKIAKD